MQIQQIPLKQLKESPTNPRKTFAKMEQLVASVKAQGGLLVPLIVRPLVSGDGYEIVAGHRRFRAAKEAKLAEVPCDVRTLDDTTVLEIQITENLQRVDLSDLEEAETFEAMSTRSHLSAEDISKRVGISLGTVYSRLKLLALCPEARKALADGVLPSSVAVPLARLPTHALQAKALKELRSRFGFDGDVGGPSVVIGARQAIEFIQKEFCRALRNAPFDVKDDMLTEGTGACAKCPKNSKCATPGLFDDLRGAKGLAFCTDVVCFDAKVKASWEATAKAAEARGAKVLDVDDGAKLFQFGNLTHGSRYVELDVPNHADRSKRPWREFYDRLPDDKKPQLLVVPDRDHRAREVVDAAQLREAIAAAPGAPKWAKEETARADALEAQRAETKEQRGAIEARERVVLEGMKKIGSTLTSVNDDLLRFVLLGLADRWVPQGVLNALEVDDRDAYEAQVGKAPSKWLRTALLMWGAYSGDLLECSDGYPAEFRALAKAQEVDVKAIEKAIEAGDAAEALMNGKKGAKS